MSELNIYNTLTGAGLTSEGACGVMGNMKAESGMKSNIAQRGMTTLSDEAYTAAADACTLTPDFAKDSVGYGLCQWTYGPRKEGLRQFAREVGASVGDEYIQTLYCLKELQDYPAVLSVLLTSHDLKRCSDIVCTDFERPAVNNLQTRYDFALEFYEKFAGQTQHIEPPVVQSAKQETSSPAPKQNDGFFSNLFGSSDGIKMKSAKMPVLKEGDTGAGVAAVQVALKYHKVDIGDSGTLGIFESGTTMGLKDFQRRNGLKATGRTDPETWSRLML